MSDSFGLEGSVYNVEHELDMFLLSMYNCPIRDIAHGI